MGMPCCCAVLALGKVCKGDSSLLRPPPGYDSVCRDPDLRHNDIYAVFDNNQSYPEYILHFMYHEAIPHSALINC